MIGRKYEAEGIARHGAKMVTAVSTVNVPKYLIIETLVPVLWHVVGL